MMDDPLPRSQDRLASTLLCVQFFTDNNARNSDPDHATFKQPIFQKTFGCGHCQIRRTIAVAPLAGDFPSLLDIEASDALELSQESKTMRQNVWRRPGAGFARHPGLKSWSIAAPERIGSGRACSRASSLFKNSRSL
jgi:hypothetical protein